MKGYQFTILVVLGIVCLALSVTTVVTSRINQKLQQTLQLQQARINNGLLGQRGQQISAALMQDLAVASTDNTRIKDLLKKYGYTVQTPSQTPATVTNKVENAPNATDTKP